MQSFQPFSSLSSDEATGSVGQRRPARGWSWQVGLWLPWLVLAGCTESRSGGNALVMSGKSEPASPQENGNSAPPSGSDRFNTNVFAVPQEELATKKDIPKLTGTITVSGYGQGLLQMDVLLPKDGSSVPANTPPITVARFKSPGPYEVLIPPGATEVGLVLILDLKGNGPDAEDPKLPYPKNPVKIEGPTVSGIDFVLDKAAVEAAAAATGALAGSGAGDLAAAAAAGQPPTASGENGAASTSAATAAPNASVTAGPSAGTGSGGTPSGAPGMASSPSTTSQAPAVNAAAAGASNVSVKRGADALATLSGGSSAPAASSSTPAASSSTPSGDTSKTSSSAGATRQPAAPPSAAPASGSAPAPSNTSGKTATPGARPTSVDGRPVTDVLDEALDGAPKLAK